MSLQRVNDGWEAVTGVTKTYRSGEREPTQRYDYDFGTATLSTAALVDVPALDAVLSSNGNNALQPDKAVAFDLEEDGELDFEIAKDQTLVHQHGGVFSTEALPTNPASNALCRPPVPDPLYFEDLEKCQASPLQCSLYGYAIGNPISFVDPTGLGVWSWVGEHVVPRVVGAGKVVAGYGIAAVSTGLCSTGAGCVIGGLGIAYGVSLAASGATDMVTGTPTNTQVNRAISSVAGQKTADNFDLAVAASTTGWLASGSPYLATAVPGSAGRASVRERAP